MAYVYPFKSAGELLILLVWEKGHPIGNLDPNIWCQDICGAKIKYSEHGNTNSEYGWEIDHIVPTAKGGATEEDNFQPLHWENNRKKGDNHPWDCP